MMMEEQLRRFRFFSYGGVHSIKKKSRDIVESLNFTAQLLNDPGNLVQLFPQGMIQSQHIEEIHFEKGIYHVIKEATAGYHLVFSVALTDYFSTRKPHVHIFIEECLLQKNQEAAAFERSYNEFYQRCRQWMIQQHKE